MEQDIIRHRARPFRYTLTRLVEVGPDIRHCPDGMDGITATCPDCGFTMAYRGIGRLRNGNLVHHFECVHSHREVISVSIAIPE